MKWIIVLAMAVWSSAAYAQTRAGYEYVTTGPDKAREYIQQASLRRTSPSIAQAAIVRNFRPNSQKYGSIINTKEFECGLAARSRLLKVALSKQEWGLTPGTDTDFDRGEWGEFDPGSIGYTTWEKVCMAAFWSAALNSGAPSNSEHIFTDEGMSFNLDLPSIRVLSSTRVQAMTFGTTGKVGTSSGGTYKSIADYECGPVLRQRMWRMTVFSRADFTDINADKTEVDSWDNATTSRERRILNHVCTAAYWKSANERKPGVEWNLVGRTKSGGSYYYHRPSIRKASATIVQAIVVSDYAKPLSSGTYTIKEIREFDCGRAPRMRGLKYFLFNGPQATKFDKTIVKGDDWEAAGEEGSVSRLILAKVCTTAGIKGDQ